MNVNIIKSLHLLGTILLILITTTSSYPQQQNIHNTLENLQNNQRFSRQAYFWNANICGNSGSPPYCCENGASNPDCCKKGRGKFCCENGANNKDCKLLKES